ncbi:GNAT family N-acetyltransferase [bacterium]|nr:GNAT family N-acetyltransferase [bacterium]
MLLLETKRLLLRPYKEEDWSSVHAYAKLKDFAQYDVWGPNTEQDSKKFVQDCILKNSNKNAYEYEFAITLKSSQKLIGGCSLRKVCEHSQVANIGYAVNPDYQKQGIATEATLTLLKHSFEALNVLLVFALCHTENKASAKVMEKCTMYKAGVVKNYFKLKTGPADAFRYEISRDQFLLLHVNV